MRKFPHCYKQKGAFSNENIKWFMMPAKLLRKSALCFWLSQDSLWFIKKF